MRTHNFNAGSRVKYKGATGTVVERGAAGRKQYVVVDFEKPIKFKKKFVGSDIEKLKSA